MPRTKLSARADAKSDLTKLIKFYSRGYGKPLSNARIGDVHGKSVYNRVNRPGDFTLDELHDLRMYLGVPEDEWKDALRALL